MSYFIESQLLTIPRSFWLLRHHSKTVYLCMGCHFSAFFSRSISLHQSSPIFIDHLIDLCCPFGRHVLWKLEFNLFFLCCQEPNCHSIKMNNFCASAGYYCNSFALYNCAGASDADKKSDDNFFLTLHFPNLQFIDQRPPSTYGQTYISLS